MLLGCLSSGTLWPFVVCSLALISLSEVDLVIGK